MEGAFELLHVLGVLLRDVLQHDRHRGKLRFCLVEALCGHGEPARIDLDHVAEPGLCREYPLFAVGEELFLFVDEGEGVFHHLDGRPDSLRRLPQVCRYLVLDLKGQVHERVRSGGKLLLRLFHLGRDVGGQGPVYLFCELLVVFLDGTGVLAYPLAHNIQVGDVEGLVVLYLGCSPGYGDPLLRVGKEPDSVDVGEDLLEEGLPLRFCRIGELIHEEPVPDPGKTGFDDGFLRVHPCNGEGLRAGEEVLDLLVLRRGVEVRPVHVVGVEGPTLLEPFIVVCPQLLCPLGPCVVDRSEARRVGAVRRGTDETTRVLDVRKRV